MFGDIGTVCVTNGRFSTSIFFVYFVDNINQYEGHALKTREASPSRTITYARKHHSVGGLIPMIANIPLVIIA
jgi:hypothetical protein